MHIRRHLTRLPRHVLQIAKFSASPDVARAAAMSILRCSSRTATGGEAYFALHAILGPLAQEVGCARVNQREGATPQHHGHVCG